MTTRNQVIDEIIEQLSGDLDDYEARAKGDEEGELEEAYDRVIDGLTRAIRVCYQMKDKDE